MILKYFCLIPFDEFREKKDLEVLDKEFTVLINGFSPS